MELFSVVRSDPVMLGWMPAENQVLIRAVVDARRLELEKLAGPLRRRGLPVASTVVTAPSVADGIVRRARQTEADMVAIQARKHGLLARLFLSQNDYDLIRHCPMPLLIVKAAPPKAKRPVIAAVDPWHADGKPKSLDASLVAAAHGMGKLLGVPVQTAHVHSPVLGYVDNSAFAPVAFPSSPAEKRTYAAMIRKRFKAFNLRHRIAARNTYLQMGDPALILPEIARATKAQMLVMGAISKARIKRILLGNTAERVLDTLPCDILVIKPEGFRSPIK